MPPGPLPHCQRSLSLFVARGVCLSLQIQKAIEKKYENRFLIEIKVDAACVWSLCVTVRTRLRGGDLRTVHLMTHLLQPGVGGRICGVPWVHFQLAI